jgi:glycosyltransferase involved in cell wall biosynthesis
MQKILLIGPLPIKRGGASILFNQLATELKTYKDLDIKIINTGRADNTKLANALLSINIISEILKEIRTADVVSFHASPRGLIYFGSILYVLSRLYRKRLIFRCFGGNLDKYSKLKLIFKAECVLLETEHLVSHFKKAFPKSRIIWHPNSRPYSGNETFISHSGNKVKFIFVGHVKPSKGIYEIIQAGIIASNSQLSIDVYGPLLEGVTEKDFEGLTYIKYKGSLPPDKVVDTMSGYDALVFPTYYEGEGHPGVILEAYMAGIPVISTRWGAIAEIVEDGVSGLLVNPRDVNGLAKAMARMNKKRIAELRCGVVECREQFNSKVWTEKFYNLLKGI